MSNKIPKYKSWVSVVAISAFCSIPPFSTLMGLLALLGFNTVRFYGEPVIGIQGLLVGIFGGLFIAGVITAFAASFGYLGLKVYARFRPVNLEY